MTLPITEGTSTATTGPTQRPVLLWHPENDESHVKASPTEAATFLRVGEPEVLAGIDAGSLVGGWFVDWAAQGQ
jgi:hypothetical protein